MKQRPGQLAAKAAKKHEPMELKNDLGIAKRHASKKKDKKPSAGSSLTKESTCKKRQGQKEENTEGTCRSCSKHKEAMDKVEVTTPKKHTLEDLRHHCTRWQRQIAFDCGDH